MENNDEMNVKIQNSGKTGQTNTKGTCRNLAEYLEHEDDERREKGLTVYPFVKPDGTPVSKEEVIAKIDRNNARLSRKDDKFFHAVVAPSKEEIEAMGSDEKSVYHNALKLIRHISDAYAAGFHNDAIEDGDDLVIYWKPHWTRGENDEQQFHLHFVVSRRAKGNGPKLSPMTNHRNTLQGPVTGGFDRKAFAARCEKLFDELIHYDRKVAETFEYNNAMAHGTAEERAEQAERLARENEDVLRTELEAAFAKRRKRKRERNEVEELSELLKKKDFSFPSHTSSVEDAIKLAEIGHDLMASMSRSADKTSLDLNLACLGLSLKPITGDNGGVADFTVTYKGRQAKASTIVDERQLITLLSYWEQLTGQASALTIRKQKKQQEAERKLKLAKEQESEQNRSRGLRMRR